MHDLGVESPMHPQKSLIILCQCLRECIAAKIIKWNTKVSFSDNAFVACHRESVHNNTLILHLITFYTKANFSSTVK